tara:strand:- start:16 stop:543 length:528 start_codon:yes stop_codon:yes gene_type:complete
MKFKGQSSFYVDYTNETDGVWIGDPCYVFPEDKWSDWCDKLFAWEKETFGKDRREHYVGETVHSALGYKWYSWSTAFGDGTYPLIINDETVAELGVDAGTLSIIPMGLIKHWNKSGEIGDYQEMGHVVTDVNQLKGELTTEAGDMFWGIGTRLPTGVQEEEEEEDDCYEQGYMWS